jgi:hypothetical protein
LFFFPDRSKGVFRAGKPARRLVRAIKGRSKGTIKQEQVLHSAHDPVSQRTFLRRRSRSLLPSRYELAEISHLDQPQSLNDKLRDIVYDQAAIDFCFLLTTMYSMKRVRCSRFVSAISHRWLMGINTLNSAKRTAF